MWEKPHFLFLGAQQYKEISGSDGLRKLEAERKAVEVGVTAPEAADEELTRRKDTKTPNRNSPEVPLHAQTVFVCTCEPLHLTKYMNTGKGYLLTRIRRLVRWGTHI